MHAHTHACAHVHACTPAGVGRYQFHALQLRPAQALDSAFGRSPSFSGATPRPSSGATPLPSARALGALGHPHPGHPLGGLTGHDGGTVAAARGGGGVFLNSADGPGFFGGGGGAGRGSGGDGDGAHSHPHGPHVPLMLVSDPKGRVLHVTEGLATMLGTTPKVRRLVWFWWCFGDVLVGFNSC